MLYGAAHELKSHWRESKATWGVGLICWAEDLVLFYTF